MVVAEEILRSNHSSALSTVSQDYVCTVEQRDAYDIWVADEPPIVEWLRTVQSTMRRFFALESNWDGYGAKRIDPSVVKPLVEILQVLRSTTPPPQLVPSPRGGVQLEWHQRGFDLEIEVLPDGALSCYFCDNSKDEDWDEDAIRIDDPRIADAIDKLSGRVT